RLDVRPASERADGREKLESVRYRSRGASRLVDESRGTRRLTRAVWAILLAAGFSWTAAGADKTAPAAGATPGAEQPGPWALLHERCEKCHNSEDWAGEVAFDTLSPQ